MERRVYHFEARGMRLDEALGRLAGDHRSRTFVIGFEHVTEAVPFRDGPKVDLVVEEGTVGEVLRALCAQDRRYTYTDAGDGVIDVYPVVEAPEVWKILNLWVAKLDIETEEWPENIFGHIDRLVPELRDYLDVRARAYQTAHHLSPPGSPGSSLASDMVPPHIRLHFESTTLRGLLNQISADTLTHTHRDVSGAEVVHPFGWEFVFRVQSDAPTGLGGYPAWRPF